ncbi:MAG: right-handed parallel beta-helix repeat-containing protein [Myxococcales bacterium]|nr:right-handed parallel beta-helix repeat-containing protein [Myxococcales bacterium]MCB9650846.1 right-handed parallel beta-helix repeat-containing protein [Deltaproteobacteria bacterium]
MTRVLISLSVLLVAGFGCGGESTVDSGTPDSGTVDSGPADTGVTPDSGELPDSGEVDAGTPDGGETPEDFPRISCASVPAPCLQFTAGQRDDLLDAVQDLADGTTIILGAGTFGFDNALTLRRAAGVTLTGQGMNETTLDFSAQTTQSNGVDVVGDRFTISELTITDATKDGLRIEDSHQVIIRRIRVTWAAGPSSENGAYGIYPVRCSQVLVEDSEASNAADAGLYVGQSRYVIVRRNTAKQNVAGIEIENTQFADVYENLSEDNTAGLVVFDLPGNPVLGHDVRLHHNEVRANNRPNFAPTSGVNAVTTVSQIPAGTGTFALASRRVEIDHNTYEDNQTVDIALLSGLVIEQDVANWTVPLADIVGNIAGADPEVFANGVANFRSQEIWVHDNSFSGGGTNPDRASPLTRPLGTLLGVLYDPDGGPSQPVDNVLYDGIEEVVDPAVPGNNTNQHHICVENNGAATYATLNLGVVQTKLEEAVFGNGEFPTLADLFRPAAPYAPFDCSGFTAGPIGPVVLPFIHEGEGAFPVNTCIGVAGTCIELEAGQENMLLDTINTLEDDTTIILGAGTFSFDNAITVRRASGVSILGQGIDLTVLDFSTQTAQANGVDVVGDAFLIQDLTIADAKKDGLRIEDSDGVVIRRVKATWTAGPSTENGSYGLYPVRCHNVLLEDSEAYNASDAGLYVGQVVNAIVRRNTAQGNVAGIEIENTQFADVYLNWAEDNTVGLAVFDLPGNPIVGRDVRIHHNVVMRNNRNNFAPVGTTVSQVPVGTGTFALASRRVEIHDNVYLSNKTTGVAILNGLVIQSSTAAWTLDRGALVGSIDGLDLPGDATTVANYVTNEIWVHDNKLADIGVNPDGSFDRQLGLLLRITYLSAGPGPVDGALYDGIGEVVDPAVPSNNTNRNHMCIGENPGLTFAVLDIERLANLIDGGTFPTTADIYQPAPPFAPFDCAGFTGGPIPDVVLP